MTLLGPPKILSVGPAQKLIGKESIKIRSTKNETAKITKIHEIPSLKQIPALLETQNHWSALK
jgi:hypothetical protein